MRRRTYPPPPCIRRLEIDARGFLYLAPDAVLEFLAHDLTATEGLVLAAAQQPIRASALLDRVTEAAWRTKPSWYGVTDEDRMISPALQREIAGTDQCERPHPARRPCPVSLKAEGDGNVILAAVEFVRGNRPRR